MLIPDPGWSWANTRLGWSSGVDSKRSFQQSQAYFYLQDPPGDKGVA